MWVAAESPWGLVPPLQLRGQPLAQTPPCYLLGAVRFIVRIAHVAYTASQVVMYCHVHTMINNSSLLCLGQSSGRAEWLHVGFHIIQHKP